MQESQGHETANGRLTAKATKKPLWVIPCLSSQLAVHVSIIHVRPVSPFPPLTIGT